MSFFGHGLVRMPKLEMFSGWMVKSFENSLLPTAIVQPFSYILPFAELFTGVLLLFGLFTRQAAIAGSCIILSLILGSALIEQWDALPTQFLHGLFLLIVLNFIEANKISLDNKLKK
ncbi:hypothetical protein GCM10007424_18560 [Flavobacterium suaedae]|uniref:DoxX family membrane protein n=2 Tax=Flavobacterium suaedae TaxID=1767027 RepID=A0ABQ1JZ60_9FLAO|nr:hypothetical protein GCM10007424_18560 [Flavobacterium suaedae]